jgi:hypothetical protein
MAGMARGLMALTAIIGISGASVEGQDFTQDHRRLPMSPPLLLSLEFLTCNPNPFSPSPHLQVSPGN